MAFGSVLLYITCTLKEIQHEDPIFKSFDNDLKYKPNRCCLVIIFSENFILKLLNCVYNEDVNCMIEHLSGEGFGILSVFFNKNKFLKII